ncbi:hypothetical protein DP73_18485 [Desulfosporosinus sp. HMP52]|uniref:tyrosine-type recombinase/integrase n=1 Tax=Desulfosporosinus sp. HMP52 TaxID=1487923 RepID=UPI00051FB80D|nr:site-specific integrase [Desulfosporosinus sp. HMP52]KGK85491.1 hypothetical protein DP73_18485 [Desulfosporosinus sp. HMP52]
MAKQRNANGEGSIHQRKSGIHEGKWVSQITIGTDPETGKPKRKTFYGKTRAEVKAKLKEAMKELEKGIDLQAQSKLSFGEWLTDWMENYKKMELRLATWENYQRSIKKHIMPQLGDIPLGNLNTSDIQKLYNKMKTNNAASATIRRNHQIINSCLSQAVKNRLISWNPAIAVTLPKLETKQVKAMNKVEMNAFLEAIETEVLRAAFLILIGTGLRLGEVLGLRWKDIDFREKTINVVQALVRTKSEGLILESPKTEKSKRLLPIPKEIAVATRLHRIKQRKIKKYAKEAYEDNDLIFSTKSGKPINPRFLTKKYYEIRKRAGISSEINLHALRHTYATRLLEEGENIKTVSELLGHTDISTTGNTYAHVMPEIKRTASDKMNNLLKKKSPRKRED